MMGVVGKHVRHHRIARGPRPRPTVALKDLGLGDHLAAARTAFSQS
jgi:hypothetical protein